MIVYEGSMRAVELVVEERNKFGLVPVAGQPWVSGSGSEEE